MTMRLISVCIATYKRPKGLGDLLSSIDGQVLSDTTDVEVIVVDNDPRTAEPTVEAHAATGRFPVRYLTQASPNISLTRNAAVEAAEGELIWFVDDDETADPHCLRRLVETLDTFSADVVFGPVLPSFASEPPAWLRPLFDRPIHETGTPSQAFRTGNTLVRASALTRISGPFNPNYGQTGGEDSFLFRQLHRDELRLVNSSDAIVTETVPVERATWEWVRLRNRRQGQIYSRQIVELSGSLAAPESVIMLGKAAAQVVGWPIVAAVTWTNRGRRARFLSRMWVSVGKLEAAVDLVRTRRAPHIDRSTLHHTE